MKAAVSFIVLALWISSWLPTSADRWVIYTVAGLCLGLVAALLVQRILGDHHWPAKAVSGLGYIALIGGALLTFLAGALGTPAEGAITLFFALGLAGYVFLIRDILSRRQTSKSHLGTGSVMLVLLAAWSWASALSMYFHIGSTNDTDASCILVPKSLRYNTELSSVWEMRLAEVVESNTGPTGTVILDYHAILVVPSDGQAEIYNWSKRWMRFERLDIKRNPYLPRDCP